MIIENGIVTKLNVEEPKEFEASKAETILASAIVDLNRLNFVLARWYTIDALRTTNDFKSITCTKITPKVELLFE